MVKYILIRDVRVVEKEFNLTGICIPKMHYMVDISSKLDKVLKLVQRGKYFVINLNIIFNYYIEKG